MYVCGLKARSDLNRKKMRGDYIQILACINCGSTNLRSGAAIDGVVPGDIPLVYFCNECEHKGAPIIFDSVEDYSRFQKVLNE
jgi:hypothetical protein